MQMFSNFFGSSNNNNNNYQQQHQSSSSSPCTPSSTATGWPLPNTDSRSIEALRAPMCGDWSIEVTHALPAFAHLHHQFQQQGTRAPFLYNNNNNNNNGGGGSSSSMNPQSSPTTTTTTVKMTRGDACVITQTGERGIYIGRPLQSARGNVAICVVRDSGVNPPRARLSEYPLEAANKMLMYLPDQVCTLCSFRIPLDEVEAHRMLRHPGSAGSGSGGPSPMMMMMNQQNNNNNYQYSGNAAGATASIFGNSSSSSNNNTPTTSNSAYGSSSIFSSNQANNNNQQQQQNGNYFFNNLGAAQASANTANVFGVGGNNNNNNTNNSNLTSPATPNNNNNNNYNNNNNGNDSNNNNNNNNTGIKLAGDTDLMKHLRKVKKLGEGAQGIVWQCKVEPESRCPPINVENGQTPGSVVLKSIRCKDRDVALNRFNQSERLRQMKSAHLVPYFCVIYDPDDIDKDPDSPSTLYNLVHVIMPYYSSGSLSQKIANEKGKFKEHWLLSTLLQLCNALNVLHGRKPQIVHGDVKPDNILMYGKTDQVLLMDLEASSMVPIGQLNVKADNDGTFEWRAPESGEGVVSTASDMWSLGVVAICLALLPDFPALKNPDSKNEEMCLNHESWTDSRLYYVIFDSVKSRGYSARTAEILCSLVRKNPKDRPTTHVLTQVLTDHMEAMLLDGNF